MQLPRRDFLKNLAALTAGAAVPTTVGAAEATASRAYPYLGRTEDYSDFKIIEPGLTIAKMESWTQGGFGLVRLTTRDGQEGYGQLSPFEADISATVLHRQLARQILGSDPARIDALVDKVIDANMKFPWSYVCRALAGVDTAVWDLYGKIKGKPVCELLGGKTDPFPVLWLQLCAATSRPPMKPSDWSDCEMREDSLPSRCGWARPPGTILMLPPDAPKH